LIGSPSHSTAEPVVVAVVGPHSGATEVGQLLPIPKRLSPLLFSLVNEAVSSRADEIHLEASSPADRRLVLRSRLAPEPGPLAR
jgi:hypothetical protein